MRWSLSKSLATCSGMKLRAENSALGEKVEIALGVSVYIVWLIMKIIGRNDSHVVLKEYAGSLYLSNNLKRLQSGSWCQSPPLTLRRMIITKKGVRTQVCAPWLLPSPSALDSFLPFAQDLLWLSLSLKYLICSNCRVYVLSLCWLLREGLIPSSMFWLEESLPTENPPLYSSVRVTVESLFPPSHTSLCGNYNSVAL